MSDTVVHSEEASAIIVDRLRLVVPSSLSPLPKSFYLRAILGEARTAQRAHGAVFTAFFVSTR